MGNEVDELQLQLRVQLQQPRTVVRRERPKQFDVESSRIVEYPLKPEA